MQVRAYLVALVLVVQSVLTLGASSSSAVLECLPAFYKLAAPTNDTSVELEMVTTPQVLSLLTTPSGLIQDFFPSSKIPREIREYFPGKSDEEIRETPWKELSPSKQLKLLELASFDKQSSFFEDRKIPHVQYTQELEHVVWDPIAFLGKHFSPGVQRIQPKEFLKGAVEYMGPENDPRGVELHFRVARPAGEVSQAARDFQQLLGVEPTHQHVYVVVPIPRESLEANPELVGARNADFFRRVNLAAEMITLVEEEGSIRERNTHLDGLEVKLFGWLNTESLVRVADYLVAQGKKRSYPLGDQVKIAWVGFRGHDKFDEPHLMGMEVRSVSRNPPKGVYERFLNAIQKSWAEQNLGISPERFEKWLNNQYEGNYREALSQNWYHKKWLDLIWKASVPLKQELALSDEDLQSRLGKLSSEELKMVLHDWSRDPLFFDNPARVRRIVQQQVKAVRMLGEKAPERSVVREFLKESGIYESVLRSLAPQ